MCRFFGGKWSARVRACSRGVRSNGEQIIRRDFLFVMRCTFSVERARPKTRLAGHHTVIPSICLHGSVRVLCFASGVDGL